jgi:aspartate 1-decarboxylase
MQRQMMHSKIHRATVTGADLNYEGSIGIDEALMDQAGILPNERVEIYNISNGQRFATYAIVEQRNSGAIVMNGAAARCAAVGDLIIIVSYCLMDDAEARAHRPKVIMVNAKNEMVRGGRSQYIRQVVR